jgi:hypothetical protein
VLERVTWKRFPSQAVLKSLITSYWAFCSVEEYLEAESSPPSEFFCVDSSYGQNSDYG